MTGVLAIEKPGVLTTVQDLGRHGHQAIGLPVSGALDSVSLRLANALVGNDPSAAGLEIRLIGPTIKVQEEPVRVALVGTSLPIEVTSPAPRSIPAGESALLEPGSVFSIGAMTDTSTCYLAVEGGFALAPAFGSLSTYLPGAIGGLDGRSLAQGDALEIGATGGRDRGEVRLPSDYSIDDSKTIRVVLGPQDSYFTEATVDEFLSSRYTVSSASNRMGLRLTGQQLSHSKGYNIPSDGICAGSIQVPGEGLPIVLLADRPTTGGYPKIATVVSADLPRLGRALPNQEIQFKAIDVEQAEKLRRQQESMLQNLVLNLENI